MKHIALLFFMFGIYCLSGQENKSVDVYPITATVKIDGILEEFWDDIPSSSPFWQYAPNDSIHAELNTELKFAADENTLYIAAICHAKTKEFVVPSLQRDFRAGGSDNLTFLIDPFNDRTNAFMFGTNPMGVQREGLISGGGANNSQFTTSWDNKWNCDAKIYEDKWIAEFAIPLSILRFNPDVSTWRINAYRFDTQINERSTWVRIPRNQVIFNLAFMGEMNWKTPPETKSQRFSLIPYVSAESTQDFETNGDRNLGYNFGGDAKIRVSSGLNLDLTANPDFSQVEVDRQVTNLSRFEIFFPERRQFFLENADLFGAFGNERANPFFSRRIGISVDTLTEENILNTIYGGARLSGKINDKLRIGMLNTLTASDPSSNTAGYNFNVMSTQYKLWKRSNIGFIAVNKDAIFNTSFDAQDPFNRVFGVDLNFATDNNRWTNKTYVHRSISSTETEGSKIAHGMNLGYFTRRLNLRWDHQYIGSEYDAQVGFVPRVGFYRINPRADVFFYQTDKKLNRINPSISLSSFYNEEFILTDRRIDLRLGMDFINQANFNIRFQNNYIFLTDSWDPTGTESVELPGNNGYSFNNVAFQFNSDRSKNLSLRSRFTIGEYYTGWRYGTRGTVAYRIQPYANLFLNYAYNVFDMPYLESLKSTVLFGPRLDISFTKKIFLSGALQYNSQSENSNLNIRFQYRFAPVSDLFIVYTDNYFTDIDSNSPNYLNVEKSNRAIVLKCSYWLNI